MAGERAADLHRYAGGLLRALRTAAGVTVKILRLIYRSVAQRVKVDDAGEPIEPDTVW